MRIFMLSILILFCLFAPHPGAGGISETDAMLRDLAGALARKDLSRLRELLDVRSCCDYAGRRHDDLRGG